MTKSPETLLKIDLPSVFERSARTREPIILELGCGPKKEPKVGEIHIGADILDLPGVDIVADLNKGLSFLPDACVDEVHSKSFFAHLDDFELVMKEIVRVLKPGGCCRAFMPHFSNPFFYSDYTHKRFFGLYTFYYFVDKKKQLRRQVPSFYGTTRIEVTSINYVFDTPFFERRPWKKFWGLIFNSSTWMKEFYEENLCYIIPCYALRVVFRPAALESK
ncbi:MAG: methyltransferase domain-containing protein [Bdellovibrionota bacterium]